MALPPVVLPGHPQALPRMALLQTPVPDRPRVPQVPQPLGDRGLLVHRVSPATALPSPQAALRALPWNPQHFPSPMRSQRARLQAVDAAMAPLVSVVTAVSATQVLGVGLVVVASFAAGLALPRGTAAPGSVPRVPLLIPLHHLLHQPLSRHFLGLNRPRLGSGTPWVGKGTGLTQQQPKQEPAGSLAPHLLPWPRPMAVAGRLGRGVLGTTSSWLGRVLGPVRVDGVG